MKAEITIDAKYTEPEVKILTSEVTKEISQLYEYITKGMEAKLMGYKEGQRELLYISEIIKLFTQDHKVYALTEQGEYVIKYRMFELEKELEEQDFLRISNTEMIHLKKVTALDMSLKGNIIVSLKGGATACVSRRYVPKIRKRLGV